MLADYFGVEMDDVRVVSQDSLSAPPHFGPGGSRLGVAITGAVLGAADILREKLIRVAAQLMQTDARDVELMDGKLRIKGVPEAKIPLAQVAGDDAGAQRSAAATDMDPNPEATYVWTAAGRTPADDQGRAKSYLTAANACHLVLVEVDVETAAGRRSSSTSSPTTAARASTRPTCEGMTQGGVAQGVGAALLEEYVYDDDGQLLTSTYMDYLLPTIYEVPMTEKKALCTPSPFTPLGAKGMGEGAIHTTPAAVMCAINDALRAARRPGARGAGVAATALDTAAEALSKS